jgi:hypothetical protein
MTRATTITAIAASAILLTWSRGAGCGSAKQGGKVLVTTETDGSGRARSADSAEKKRAAPEPNAALRDRMLADERRAAEIVKTAMCQKEGHGAAWAAIYALRLGIRHDAGCAAEALRRGVGSDDDLLRALSWRWLAAKPEVPLPKGAPAAGADPVVRVMAALAHAARGALPRGLAGALALPGGAPRGADSRADVLRRTARLKALGTPFDNGPLALAVAFVEARQEERAEKRGSGAFIWSAERLRKELISSVKGGRTMSARLVEAISEPPSSYSDMGNRLDNRLVTRPLEMLRNIALSGPESLRKESLRAIAVLAARPVAGDFGAAAAAMSATSRALRLEGARTYLLLLLRIQK